MSIRNKRNIFNYIITVGSRGMGRLFMLIVSVLIARQLGADNFGLYSLFFGVFILIVQALSGINIAYVRFVKTVTDVSDEVMLRLSLFLQLAIIAILLIGGWPISLLMAHFLKLETMMIPYLGFIASGLLGLFGIWFGFYQAKGRFLWLGIFNLAFNFLIMLVVAGAWLLDIDLSWENILWAHVALSFLLGVGSLIAILRVSHGMSLDRQLATDFTRMVSMNMSITLFYFMYRYVDIYFIQYYLDTAAVGIYAAAMKTSMMLNILTAAMPTILLPKAVDSIKSSGAIRRYFKNSYGLASIILLAFAVFYLISPFFLTLLFGEEYSEAGPMLQWLVLGWCANVLYIPVAQIFYALNTVGWRLSLEIFKLATTVVLMMIFIPQYGAIGCAYALLFAASLTFIAGLLVAAYLLNRQGLLTQHVSSAL